MTIGGVINTLSSLGFILLVAHSTGYQQAHWPEGRVVYVHPWFTVISYGLIFVTVVLWLSGTRDPEMGQRLNVWMPRAAWALLIAAVVVMPLGFPGPYPE